MINKKITGRLINNEINLQKCHLLTMKQEKGREVQVDIMVGLKVLENKQV